MFGCDRSRALTTALVIALVPASACGRTLPSPIAVPPALRAMHESIEPSGVVWAAPIDRYLVVSDDTGPEEGRHAPWLLTMDRQGRFDAEPVRIHGIDELNDAESICAGPRGTFFVTTSHSPSVTSTRSL